MKDSPRKAEAERKKPITISMSQSEKEMLARKAREHGRSLSNFMIWAAKKA